MSAIHRLKIFHRIPVVLDKDDSVGTRERETKPTDMRCEQQAVNARVRIEGLDDGVPLRRLGVAVQPHVGHRRHVLPEEVVFDDFDHLLHLAEDEHAMLG